MTLYNESTLLIPLFYVKYVKNLNGTSIYLLCFIRNQITKNKKEWDRLKVVSIFLLFIRRAFDSKD